MDRQGRVTSHLSGLIYRLSNFVAAGIKPAFVFDGEPPRLKARTLVARGEVKQRAEREWREAVEIGDLATARTKAMQTSRLTDEMVEQSKKLLELLGLPWVRRRPRARRRRVRWRAPGSRTRPRRRTSTPSFSVRRGSSRTSPS